MNAQKIALFTSTEGVGQRLTEEALKRGHNVTAIVQNENEFKVNHPNLKIVKGDVRNKEDVRRYARGNDVIVCAYNPFKTQPKEYAEITRSIIQGAKDAGVERIIAAGHPVEQAKETTQEFYDEFKPVMRAQQEALNFSKLKRGYIGVMHTPLNPKLTNKNRENIA